MNKKSTTIFVVEAGDYSDSRIVGAFTEKERAEKYASRFNVYGNGRVLELELDVEDSLIPNGYEIYEVSLDFVSADVSVVRRLDPDMREDLDEKPMIINASNSECYFEVTVMARSREHAIKIANERLAEWKAEHPEKPEEDDMKYTPLFDGIEKLKLDRDE